MMKSLSKTALIIAAWISLFSAGASAAGHIDARARIDRNSITIGDRIKLSLDVTVPRQAELQMPAFKDGLMGDFEIKDSSVRSRDHLFGGKTYNYVYFVTAYSTGKKNIPAIDIKYKLRGSGDWALNKTKAIPVDVRSVLPKVMPADIKDIRGPLSYFEINWILVIFVLALIAFIAAAVIFYIRMRSRKPVRLPHETALEELEVLRARLANNSDVKEYFVGVSDCIRSYIERVFKLKAPEMTSEEFLNSLHGSRALTVSHRDLLTGFMDACDMVKFAKYSPKPDEIDNVYATARNFINETTQSLPG